MPVPCFANHGHLCGHFGCLETVASARAIVKRARARAGEFSGTKVTLLGVMVDEEVPKVEASLKPFEDATGIDMEYNGTS